MNEFSKVLFQSKGMIYNKVLAAKKTLDDTKHFQHSFNKAVDLAFGDTEGQQNVMDAFQHLQDSDHT